MKIVPILIKSTTCK